MRSCKGNEGVHPAVRSGLGRWVLGLALGLGMVTALAGCSAPPTVEALQSDVLRDVKLHLEAKGWNPATTQLNYDDVNSAWRKYWAAIDAPMRPEDRKWNDRLHDLWVYQAVPADLGSAHVLWIFVERATGRILGDHEAH